MWAQGGDVQARSAALSGLFKEMWEDRLKRSPEFASSLGDRRYNDQLSDISPRAINDELARRRVFLTRLVAIDTTRVDGAGEALERADAARAD